MVDVDMNPKRSLRPENIAKLQEQLVIEEGWGLKRGQGELDFPLNDSSARAGDPAFGRLTSDFSDWQHFRDVVEGPKITNMAHSLVWNTDFIARVNTQSKYFDDFREKEAAKPLRDTRAVRLRNQRAKQMAGRFRLANNKAQKEKDAGGHGPPMSARSDRSDAGSNKQMIGGAAKMRVVPIPEKPVDNTEGGPNGKKKGRRRRKPAPK